MHAKVVVTSQIGLKRCADAYLLGLVVHRDIYRTPEKRPANTQANTEYQDKQGNDRNRATVAVLVRRARYRNIRRRNGRLIARLRYRTSLLHRACAPCWVRLSHTSLRRMSLSSCMGHLRLSMMHLSRMLLLSCLHLSGIHLLRHMRLLVRVRLLTCMCLLIRAGLVVCLCLLVGSCCLPARIHLLDRLWLLGFLHRMRSTLSRLVRSLFHCLLQRLFALVRRRVNPADRSSTRCLITGRLMLRCMICRMSHRVRSCPHSRSMLYLQTRRLRCAMLLVNLLIIF